MSRAFLRYLKWKSVYLQRSNRLPVPFTATEQARRDLRRSCRASSALHYWAACAGVDPFTGLRVTR